MRVRSSVKPMYYQGLRPITGQELIDRAEIREAQAALDADPQNAELQAALGEVKTKIAGRKVLTVAITTLAFKRTDEEGNEPQISREVLVRMAKALETRSMEDVLEQFAVEIEEIRTVLVEAVRKASNYKESRQ